MDVFWKITAGILLATILTLVVSKQAADISLLVTVFTCCMAMCAAMQYLKPIIDFTQRLVRLGDLDHELLTILLKVTGIGLTSQVIALICTDAGSHSLAKALQIVTTIVILCLCIPLLEQMLSLIETMLRIV